MTATLISPDRPAHAGPARADWARRLLGNRDRVAIILIGLIAFVTASWNIAGAPAYQDDEGTYTAQAVSVLGGDFAPYTYWYDHPPFGWVQLAVAGWLPLTVGLGGSDIAAMRFVIALFFAATAMLLFALGRRIGLRRTWAVVAAAVFALSPLSLEYGRQVYLDAVAMPWLLASFYAALSPRRALWHHVGAGVFFAIAVLSKETFAIFGPALLLAILDRNGWHGRAFSIVGFLTVGGLVLAFYPLLAALRGELVSGPGHVSLQDGLAYQFFSRSGSGWLWEAGSARSDLLLSWIGIDPVLVYGGVAAAVVCAFGRRTRWIAIALACFALPLVAGQGYLPAMYVMGAAPFLAMGLAAAGDAATSGFQRLSARLGALDRRRAGLAVGIAAVLAIVPAVTTAWAARDAALLTEDRNADWNRALAWAQDNIPRDDVVVVPYSMWQDLDSAGWHDPWKAIVVEKVDLDSEFAARHPGGWREIDWIVEGPSVEPNIGYLGLEQVGQALDASTTVATFGDWSIRRVDASSAP